MVCCGGCFTFRGAVKLGVLIALVAAFCAVVDQPSHWVFDPKTLKEVAQRGIANAAKANNGNATAEQVIKAVIAETTKQYPKYAKFSGDWLFNNAGGAMGSMTVLHSSLSEYLIVFGTAVGTEGHTGRFAAEDFFTIIHGEQWAYKADSFEREVYKVGDQHFLPRGVAKQYRMPDSCFALEYARGNIVSMMFFGLADTFTSTLDVVTLAQNAYESGFGIARNLLEGKV